MFSGKINLQTIRVIFEEHMWLLTQNKTIKTIYFYNNWFYSYNTIVRPS